MSGSDDCEGPEDDLEPSLGWTTRGAFGGDADLEDDDDRELDGDGEPSLGWTIDGVFGH